MKIRSNFVSNSSSSSFVIAYDPTFFGNFLAFLEMYQPGCETAIYNLDHLKEDRPELMDKVEKAKKNGMQVAYFQIDNEYRLLIELMSMINESNGGNKMEIIDGFLDD